MSATRRRASTPLGWLLATLLAVGLAPVGAGRASAAPDPCPLKVVEPAPLWSSIEVPPFEASLTTDEPGASLISAVHNDPGALLAGWANELALTRDGGCTWKSIFPRQEVDTPQLDCNTELVVIIDPGCFYLYDVDVAVTESGTRIYAQFFNVAVWNGKNTLLLASDDWGSTWTRVGVQTNPEMSVGIGPLTIAPSDPRTVYVKRGVLDATASDYTGAPVLWISKDGGATWTSRPAVMPGGALAMSNLESLDVNPQKADEIWSIALHKTPEKNYETLVRSRDAGVTWQEVRTPIEQQDARFIKSFDVDEAPGREPVVAVSSTDGVWVSMDAGTVWKAVFTTTSNDLPHKVVIGSGASYLFVIGNLNMVARLDLQRQTGKMIKERAFVGRNGTLTDMQSSEAVYGSGAGLVVMGDCPSFGCHHLFRYQGKGT